MKHWLLFASALLTTQALEHVKLKTTLADVIPNRYIIGFKADTLFTQAFRQQNDLHIHQHYDHEFFNGVSIHIDNETRLSDILERADVAYVSPVRRIPRPQVIVQQGQRSVLPHRMTQVDLVHDMDNKGQNVLVGILDTGVDYLHPALGGGFGEGYKVSTGYDLVGDAYTGDNKPVPDSDPLDDCGAESGASGHGTHVSGIIAGFDDNFTGVAPEANLAMYRVFGCNGATGDDVIVKALLMAYDAGVDVINLSLGSTNPWTDVASDPEIDVVNQIMAKGVHVVISAGNAGNSGAYTLSSPSSARGAFSVASVENEFYNTTTLLASGFQEPILYSISGGQSLELVSGDLAVAAKQDVVGDACKMSDVSEDVKGKVVLIQRGVCSFTDKVNNAAAAGAISVIFYDNNNETLSGASTPGGRIASVMVTLTDGRALLSAVQNRTVQINFDAGYSIVPVADGGAISDFSSLGPSAELVFKPNIAGVGGRVYSTLPRFLGGWGIMSGTSMASPYVAGSIALYLHAHGKEHSVGYVQEQFQNYASPRLVDKTTTTDNPIRTGAGLVQVLDAITQQVHISPAEISFNDTATNKYRTHTLVITNHGLNSIQYQLFNQVSTGVAPYNRKQSGYTPLQPAVNTEAKAKLKFSQKTVTIPSGGSETITVTVSMPKTNAHDHIYYGGYIALRSNQTKEVRVPYLGVNGKQKDLPIFDKGFPYVSDGYSRYGPKDTLTFARNTTGPYTAFRLLHPTREIKAELIHLKTNIVIGKYWKDLTYLPRNFLDESDYYNAFSWDGTFFPAGFKGAFSVPAPVDVYKFRVSALKMMGNPHLSSDWEVFTSGPIRLTE
ncbi:hypothetical protein G6F56_002002 [Rhizopus delemar]|nr:hypothetical protein G6F56_002002 [Rhizopus delemar]